MPCLRLSLSGISWAAWLAEYLRNLPESDGLKCGLFWRTEVWKKEVFSDFVGCQWRFSSLAKLLQWLPEMTETRLARCFDSLIEFDELLLVDCPE
jgi:hypothetical protein